MSYSATGLIRPTPVVYPTRYNLFTLFIQVFNRFIFIDLFLYFVDNDQLAQSSTYCLENLITSNGSKFGKANWDCTCQTIVSMFDSMMPRPSQEQNSQSEVCIFSY